MNFEYYTARLSAYAFFQGQVRGIRQLLMIGLIDIAEAEKQLAAADAKLESELEQLRLAPRMVQ